MNKVNFFCINLPTRHDRWLNCSAQFKRQRLEVNRWNATPLPKNRRFGAGLSHREIIKYAKDKDWEYVGVFEDDVVFMVDNFLSFVEESLDALKEKEWYILYFGGLICRNAELINDPGIKGLFRVRGLMCTHAVIYSKKFYDIYLRLHPDRYSDSIPELYINNKYKALDEWMALEFQNKFPCYITKKFLAGQGDSFSNIEGKITRGNSRSIFRFNIYKYGLRWLAQIGGKIKDLFKG